MEDGHRIEGIGGEEPQRPGEDDFLEPTGADVGGRSRHACLPGVGLGDLLRGQDLHPAATVYAVGGPGHGKRDEVVKRRLRDGVQIGTRLHQRAQRERGRPLALGEEETRKDEEPGRVAGPGRRRGAIGIEGEAA